jgi:hypoxanthine-DNA glycosylase
VPASLDDGVGQQITSLPAVVPVACTVLVLGSMPGEVSLARAEYYAHPRNRFWSVMGELCGAHAHLDYDARLERLRERGVALWDVLQHCVRRGSLDASILAASEVPNDFAGLLAREPRLHAVALNGAKAAATFRRRILPGLDARTAARLTLLDMPSTSPANASWSLDDLLGEWRRIGPFLKSGA